MNTGSETGINKTTTLSNPLLNINSFEIVTLTIAYTGNIYVDGSFSINLRRQNENLKQKYYKYNRENIIKIADRNNRNL